MTVPERARMGDVVAFEDAEGAHRGRVVGLANNGDLVVAGSNDQGYRVPVENATVEGRSL